MVCHGIHVQTSMTSKAFSFSHQFFLRLPYILRFLQQGVVPLPSPLLPASLTSSAHRRLPHPRYPVPPCNPCRSLVFTCPCAPTLQVTLRAGLLNPRMVLGVLTGLAGLEAQPREAWLADFLQGCAPGMAGMAPKQLARSYAALTRLSSGLAEDWGVEFGLLMPLQQKQVQQEGREQGQREQDLGPEVDQAASPAYASLKL